MKKYINLVLLLTVFVSNAQHSFFRGSNNYVAPTVPMGNVSNGLFFDGVNDYVVNTPLVITPSLGFTIEGWIKVNDLGFSAMATQTINNLPAPFDMYVSDGTGKVSFLVGQGNVTGFVTSNTSLTIGTWAHLAFVYSPSIAKVLIYINGVQDGIGNASPPGNVAGSKFIIGNRYDNFTGLNGTLDDVRIWNVAKTSTEILTSMNTELIGSETGLIAYFKFNEGVPCGNNTAITTLINSATLTGSSYNATLSGFTLNGTCVSNFVDGKVNTNNIGSTVVSVPTVTSAGGRIWMDRNLGAAQVATSITDAEAYGDLYQWGRGSDNHHLRTSGNTNEQSTTDTPGNSLFIYGSTDWRNPSNNNLWQGVNGTNNPCPSGFRLPTKVEWETEVASWSIQNATGAFASPLKLPTAGFRNPDGVIYLNTTFSDYWSSTVVGSNAGRMFFYPNGAGTDGISRTYGFSCRCIKE